MKQLYTNLTIRERQMVLGAFVFLILFIIYQSWTSFTSYTDKLQYRVDNQQQLLSWMQQAAREVKLLRGTEAIGERPKGKQLLLGLIDRTAKQNNLAGSLQKVQPEGEQGVRIWMEKAQFDNVVIWLDTLQYKHGLVVSDVSMDSQDVPGVINVRALIEAP